MQDDKQEKNPFIFHFEDLSDWTDNEEIKIIHDSNEKTIVKDMVLNKKLVITKESVGNCDELIKNNPTFAKINIYGYKLGNYVEIDIYNFISTDLYFDYVIENDIYFFIADVKVSIHSSTELFRLLKDLDIGYYTYVDDNCITLSLNGITKINYSDYFNISFPIRRTIEIVCFCR